MTKKKLLSLILAVCMVITLLPAGLITAFADGDDIPALQLGANDVYAPYNTWEDEESGNVSYEYTEYSFTPDISATYWFCSGSGVMTDPYCYVRDADGYEFEVSGSTDDYGEFRNFLFSAELEGGETYYIYIGHYEYDISEGLTDLSYKLYISTENSFAVNTFVYADGSSVFAPPYSEEGAEVSFILYPETPVDAGSYSVSVTYEEPDLGIVDVVWEENNGLYTFEMPATSVTIEVYAEDDPDDPDDPLNPEDYIELLPGANLISADCYGYNFTPDESGTYYFCSVSTCDPCCDDLFDTSTGEQVEVTGDMDDVESVSGLYDFSFSADLEADTTYQLRLSELYGNGSDYNLYIGFNGLPIGTEVEGEGYIHAPVCAAAGDTVAFKPFQTSREYNLSGVSASYFDDDTNTDVEIDCEVSDGIYYFEMPASPVTITATFEGLSSENATELFFGINSISIPASVSKVFSFTPDETDTYVFYTDAASPIDTKAVLYDSDFSELTSNDDSTFVGSNFEIDYTLEAGGTYYLVVSEYDCRAVECNLIVDKYAPVSFVSHTLELSGEIGVRFNLKISEDVVFEDSYVDFTVGKSGRQRQYFSDLGYDPRYGCNFLTCYVGAYRMADEITPVIHYFLDDEESTITLDSYSVKDYINYVLDNTVNYADEEVALVKSLADLGYYSQIYLSDLHGYEIGENGKYAQMPAPVTEEYDYADVQNIIGDRSQYALEYDHNKVEKVTFSLNLEASTCIYLYVTVKDGVAIDSVVDGDYNNIEFTQVSDSVYKIAIRDILAYNLGEYYTIYVYDESSNELAHLWVNPLAYVARVLELNAENPEKAALCDTVCAVYNYYAAACAVKDMLNEEPIGPYPFVP